MSKSYLYAFVVLSVFSGLGFAQNVYASHVTVTGDFSNIVVSDPHQINTITEMTGPTIQYGCSSSASFDPADWGPHPFEILSCDGTKTVWSITSGGVVPGNVLDADGDGYMPSPYGGSPGGNYSDCDDSEPLAFPGNPEILGDGIDNDCNGIIDAGLDSDNDTIPDSTDICPGFDDRLDSDQDGIPDDCDTIPNGCQNGGTEQNGVCTCTQNFSGTLCEVDLQATDSDGDKIMASVDEIDSDPNNNTFRDQITGFVDTFGTITSRGNQILTINDEADPQGVRISSATTSGNQRATIEHCANQAVTRISKGSSVLVKCSSVAMETLSGSIDSTLYGSGGRQIDLVLSQGQSLYFVPETFTVKNTGDTPLTITYDGKSTTINSGDTTQVDSKHKDKKDRKKIGREACDELANKDKKQKSKQAKIVKKESCPKKGSASQQTIGKQITDQILFVSPKKQASLGMTPEDVICNGDLIPMKRVVDKTPMCVKPISADALSLRGLATFIE